MDLNSKPRSALSVVARPCQSASAARRCRHFFPAFNPWLFLAAGELGFEPRQADPESAVLPLHHSPKSKFKLNDCAAHCCGHRTADTAADTAVARSKSLVALKHHAR